MMDFTKTLSDLRKQEQELIKQLSPEERAIFNQFNEKKNALINESLKEETTFERIQEIQNDLLKLKNEYAADSNK
jgi:hypothetical protein